MKIYLSKNSYKSVEFLGIHKNEYSGKLVVVYRDYGEHIPKMERNNFYSSIRSFNENYLEYKHYPLFNELEELNKNAPKYLPNSRELSYLKIYTKLTPVIATIGLIDFHREGVMVFFDSRSAPTDDDFFAYIAPDEGSALWCQKLIKELKQIVKDIYEPA